MVAARKIYCLFTITTTFYLVIKLYTCLLKKKKIIIQTELVKNKLRKQPVKYSLIGIIFLGGGGLGGGIMETWLFENWLATGRGVGHKGSLFNLSRLSCSSVY